MVLPYVVACNQMLGQFARWIARDVDGGQR